MGRARKNYRELLEEKDAQNVEYKETFFFNQCSYFPFNYIALKIPTWAYMLKSKSFSFPEWNHCYEFVGFPSRTCAMHIQHQSVSKQTYM